MKPTITPSHTVLWSAIILALSGSLASCGGNDDGPSVQPAADKEHSIPLDDQRIEPRRVKSAESSDPLDVTPALPHGALVATITLPPLKETKRDLKEPEKGQPLHIGTVRAIGQANANEVAKLLRWQPLKNGRKAAALRFVSPDAAGARLAVDVQALPEGAVLRFYDDQGEIASEITAKEAARLRSINENAGLASDTTRLVWSHTVDGDAITLEVDVPTDVSPDTVVIAVPKLVHNLLTLQQAIEKDTGNIGSSGSCNLNVTCEVDSLDDESRSVAKMTFVGSSSSYLCTGTLINDASSSGTPNFLTANHCIGTQEEASTLETQWFFRAWKCDRPTAYVSGGNGRTVQLVGGAEMLFTNSTYDTSLLKLNKNPPRGAIYAGSYFGNAIQKIDGVISLHHPSGDLQKYSVGRVIGYATCGKGGCMMDVPAQSITLSPTATRQNTPPSTYNHSSAPMFAVGWIKGSTETGSSGSAVFVRDEETGTRYVAGVLHAGSASCEQQNGFDFYGRFGLVYNAGLKDYLQ